MYKGKDDKSECGNYWGINLLNIPGKVHRRIVIERVQNVTNDKMKSKPATAKIKMHDSASATSDNLAITSLVLGLQCWKIPTLFLPICECES